MSLERVAYSFLLKDLPDPGIELALHYRADLYQFPGASDGGSDLPL